MIVARRETGLATALLIAIALRALFLFEEPLLSGDVYRYLSDGRVVAAGGNPYEYTPSDPRINHPEIRSIYPPLAQALFGLVHTLAGWRLLVIAFDVAAVILLRGRGAFAYATLPLSILEGMWNGHIDAIAGALVLFATLRSSAVASGLAAGLKVIPAAALPPLLRQARRERRSLRFALVAGAVIALPFLPFAGGPVMPGFRDYATRWIFASPLYDAVRLIVESLPVKSIWTHHPLRFELISDWVYRHLYADFLTRAVLATVAVAGMLTARTATTAIGALLVCSPAIHPWYWLTLLPAAISQRSRWTALACAWPLSYLLYERVTAPLVYVAIAAAAFLFTAVTAHET